jgi:hypothetical protein
MAIETIGGVFSLANQSITIDNISNAYFTDEITVNFSWVRLSGDFTIELCDTLNDISPTIGDAYEVKAIAFFAQETTEPTELTSSSTGSFIWTGRKTPGMYKLRIYSNDKPSIYTYSNEFSISMASLAMFAMEYPVEPLDGDNNHIAMFAMEYPGEPLVDNNHIAFFADFTPLTLTIEKVNETIVMT